VDIEIDVCRRISKVQLLPETVKSQLLLMLPDFYSRMMKIHYRSICCGNGNTIVMIGSLEKAVSCFESVPRAILNLGNYLNGSCESVSIYREELRNLSLQFS
jgi:hypothetical protein